MLKLLSISLFAFLLIIRSVFAQDLNDDFISLGTVNATIDGEVFQFIVPYETTTSRGGMFTRKNRLGHRTIQITGATVSSTGRPGFPTLTLGLVIRGNSGSAILIDMTYTDDQGYEKPILANALGTGNLELISLELSDGEMLSLVVAATAARVDLSADISNPVVVEGAPEVRIEATFEVTLIDPN